MPTLAVLTLGLQAACLGDIGAFLFQDGPDDAAAFRRAAPNCRWPHQATPAPDALHANVSQLSRRLDPSQATACARAWNALSAMTAQATPAACPEPDAPQDAAMIAGCRLDQGAMQTIEQASNLSSACEATPFMALFQSVFVRFEGAAYLQDQLDSQSATPDRSSAYWSAAYYLAQHAEMAPEIQEPWLEAVTAAVAAGNADPYLQAGLTDRLAIAEGRGQLYGTHTACVDGAARFQPGLADRNQAEARRTAIGLPDLDTFVQARSLSRCAPR